MYKPVTQRQQLVHIYEAHSMHMVMQYSLITKSRGANVNHVGLFKSRGTNFNHMGPMQASWQFDLLKFKAALVQETPPVSSYI